MKTTLLLTLMVAAAVVGAVETSSGQTEAQSQHRAETQSQVEAQSQHRAEAQSQHRAEAKKKRRAEAKKEPAKRDMSIVVIDDKGQPCHDAEVFASIRGGGEAKTFSRVFRDEPLSVAETDTIDLFVNDRYYEFSPAGRGTLIITVNSPELLAAADSITTIEPVVVAAVAPRMIYRSGQLINADSHAGSSISVPIRKGQSLDSALDWRGVNSMRGALIYIVDGSPIRGRLFDYEDIAAITVHRDAGTINMYAGPYGGGVNVGAVVEITTKKTDRRKWQTRTPKR